jgi:outer membrane protein assembly factor BamB
MKCTKLPGGEIICLLQEGRIVRLNAAGKQISGFRIDFGLSLLGGRLYLTPEGNAMVALYNHNKVVEFDQTGKIVWQVKVEQPIAAVRLPNGNTLVTSMSQNRAVEFDRNGAEVWQYRQSTRVTRAIRR